MSKVFVGGLAWETPKEALYDHFITYGDILEAVVISDKITRRSKGYGFVTFKDEDSAKKACLDPNPVINGRRANCNLASLRPHQTPQELKSGNSNVGITAPVGNNVQWYYPAEFSHHHHIQRTLPFYRYPTAYMNFNSKMGGYMNVQPHHQHHHHQHHHHQHQHQHHQMMPFYTCYPYHQNVTFTPHFFSLPTPPPISSGNIEVVLRRN